MGGTVSIARQRVSPLYVQGASAQTSGTFVVPSFCSLMKVWASAAGGGGGGGFSGATGGGGGGGGAGSACAGYELPVVPGETLTWILGGWGAGGAIGAAGGNAPNVTGIQRGPDYIFRLAAGTGGSPGQAALGGNGAQGAGDIYMAGGAGAINANGGGIGVSTTNNAFIVQWPFIVGSSGCGGSFSNNGTSYRGGNAQAFLANQLYGNGGNSGTAVGSGGGGAGGVGWPRIWPLATSSTLLPGNGGDDGLVGVSSNIWGHGGGGGGRNAAGGNGGPAMIYAQFLAV